MSKYWHIGGLFLVVTLAVAAAVFAIVTRGGVRLRPADSPEGVLQRYLLAAQKGHYEEAYQYLSAAAKARCPFESFVRGSYWREDEEDVITLDAIQNFGSRAVVRATITRFDPGAPLGASESSYDRTYTLEIDGGQWRLSAADSYCPPF